MFFIRKLARRRRRQIRILAGIRTQWERLRSAFYREPDPDPDWPRNEQYIHAAWECLPGMQKQSLGYFLYDPPRFVPCPHLYAPQTAIGMKGVEEMCGSIPWGRIFFWAPFRNETEAE
jgi:hypothetical protein